MKAIAAIHVLFGFYFFMRMVLHVINAIRNNSEYDATRDIFIVSVCAAGVYLFESMS